MTLDILLRLIANLVPLLGQFLTFLGSLHKRYQAGQAILRKVGALGWEFWVVCIASTRLMRLLVQVVLVMAGIMLITGLILAYAPTEFVEAARPKGFWVLERLFRHSWIFLVIYI